MDVTPQIQELHRIYGGSDNTNQGYTSSSRALNYSKGASIQRPDSEIVSDIPRKIEYKDRVGLFGSENHFVKVSLKLQNPISGDYVINDYLPALITEEIPYGPDPYTHANNGYDEPGQAFIDVTADLEDDYSCKGGDPVLISEETVTDDPYTFENQGYDEPGQAFVDENADLATVNSYEPANYRQGISEGPICVLTYQPAQITNESVTLSGSYFKVELINLKTGNIYVDSWLDVRLYNKHYDEHPYDIMYVKHNEPFYIGFHARNTRRLEYNVLCKVADYSVDPELPPFGELKDFDNRYLATRR